MPNPNLTERFRKVLTDRAELDEALLATESLKLNGQAVSLTQLAEQGIELFDRAGNINEKLSYTQSPTGTVIETEKGPVTINPRVQSWKNILNNDSLSQRTLLLMDAAKASVNNEQVMEIQGAAAANPETFDEEANVEKMRAAGEEMNDLMQAINWDSLQYDSTFGCYTYPQEALENKLAQYDTLIATMALTDATQAQASDVEHYRQAGQQIEDELIAMMQSPFINTPKNWQTINNHKKAFEQNLDQLTHHQQTYDAWNEIDDLMAGLDQIGAQAQQPPSLAEQVQQLQNDCQQFNTQLTNLGDAIKQNGKTTENQHTLASLQQQHQQLSTQANTVLEAANADMNDPQLFSQAQALYTEVNNEFATKLDGLSNNAAHQPARSTLQRSKGPGQRPDSMLANTHKTRSETTEEHQQTAEKEQHQTPGITVGGPGNRS